MQKAPPFTLLNENNEAVSLSDFLGKRVLIFFYPKADTPGCTTQACGFRDAYPQIEAHGAVVLGISPDSPKDLAKWKAKQGFPFMLLSDPDHTVAEAYGVWDKKSFWGNTFMGVIRSHFIVDEQGNLAVEERKISPKDSVKRGIKELLSSE